MATKKSKPDYGPAYAAWEKLAPEYREVIPQIVRDIDGTEYVQWYQVAEHWLDQTKITDRLAEIAIEWGEAKQNGTL